MYNNDNNNNNNNISKNYVVNFPAPALLLYSGHLFTKAVLALFIHLSLYLRRVVHLTF